MFLWVALCLPQAGAAQDRTTPLKVCWTLGPPYYSLDENGNYSGFFIEFTKRVAQEIGVPFEIIRRDSYDDCVTAQSTGEATFVAGAGDFDVFRENNVFSKPTGRVRHRTFVLRENRARFDPLTTSGKKVVIWREDMSPEISAMAKRNIVVPIKNPGDAMFALISGDVEAIVFPEDAVQVWAHRAGVDDRIVQVGAPMAEFDRVVVLNRGRADLMPDIEKATAKMQADGSLAALRSQFGIGLFAAAPEVLTVGVPMKPKGAIDDPYYAVDSAGNRSGFAVEVFDDLARLAGLRYTFVEVSPNDVLAGPGPNSFDVVAVRSMTPGGQESMDYTLPIETAETVALVRREDIDTFTTVESLKGHWIGFVAGSFAARQLSNNPDFQSKTYYGREDMIAALIRGEIDAALGTEKIIAAIAESQQGTRYVRRMTEPFFTNERSIALRFGLGEAREQLNAVIPGYIVSERYADLRRKYLEPKVFWTETRRYMALAAMALVTIGLFVTAVALLLSQRARRHAESASRIAEIKSTEAQRHRIQLEAVMNAAQSGIVALDRQGRMLIVNAQARHMLGLGEGPTPLDWPVTALFIDPATQLPLSDQDCPINKTMGGEPLSGEVYAMQKHAGAPVQHIQIASSVLPLDVSPEIGSVVILHDVTEHELNRARAQRTDRLSAVGLLTGGVAHDFNNLLAVILGNLELLREWPNHPDRDAMIDAGIEASLRGADLTRSMLSFARKAPLKPTILDLNDVARHSNNWMRRILPESVEVETSLLGGLWSIEVDPSSLENAFLNLMLNARDAMDGHGKLTIETANIRMDQSYIDARGEELRPGRYVMLAISDTGSGIQPAVLQKMFDPFFTTKPTGSGSGMGLSMVLGFVKQSGGTVQVYTEVGVGTTFKLYFPAVDKAGTPDHPEQDDNPLDYNGGGRILLAEDEDSVRKMLVTTLQIAGFEVVAAENGDTAEQIFTLDQNFDLLVTDIVMPGTLQGTHLARNLRRANPDLPVVFLSGYASEATVHGNGLRPEDIRLMKPVRKSELLEGVKRALAMQEAKKSDG
jgi:signal transduction histidine kinase/ABC-type amino acid transport substrate-binding protein/ActR/RegA family two-component response regulator